jgi:MscS family membrane protein
MRHDATARRRAVAANDATIRRAAPLRPAFRLVAIPLAAVLIAAFPARAHPQAGPPSDAGASTGASAPDRDPEAGAPDSQGGPALETVAPDSPRASLSAYLDLCREGRHDAAARYLDLSPDSAGRGAELARRLKAVLDRHAWFDLDLISPRSGGDTEDGLPPGLEEIASIPGPGSVDEPVRLARRAGPEGARWVFTRGTVDRIDPWYMRLGDRWLLETLPEPFLRPGPANLLWWQWLALPFLLLVAWGIALPLSRITRAALGRLGARTSALLRDAVVGRLGGPLTLAWAVAAAYVLLPWLGLLAPAAAAVQAFLRVGLFLAFFWGLLRCIDILDGVITRSAWAREHPAARTLVPLGGRTLKVAVVAMAAVAIISELGYPVASLVAGLGIGGLALALAAQKTVEHLFGSFSIGVDQPFREGDFVRIEDFVGTVEEIGLRSTRFRTLDRTLITIPNGRLADMRIESFTARDRMRLACTIGLVYGTTAAQMRRVLEGLEGVLRRHPRIWPDAVVVRFKEFAASSLDIEVMAWFMTPEWSEFQLIRQEVLLGFMEVVEAAGTSFAFPTRTVHLAAAPPAAPPAAGDQARLPDRAEGAGTRSDHGAEARRAHATSSRPPGEGAPPQSTSAQRGDAEKAAWIRPTWE